MRPVFCICCGAALVPREVEGRQRQVCPACDRVSYENPVPAAAAVIRRDSGVLLVRRAIGPRKGCWGLPAGYQEIDESPETTAVREVREETGLIVRVTDLLDVLATHDDPRKTSLLVIYKAEEMAGELHPGVECDEVGFHPVADLPRDLAFHNDRIILERLCRGEESRW